MKKEDVLQKLLEVDELVSNIPSASDDEEEIFDNVSQKLMDAIVLMKKTITPNKKG